MKNKSILIYGGTTEGRRLAEELCKKDFLVTVCVATEYGESVMEAMPGLTVLCGRLVVREMEELLAKEQFLAVIDATHPFAAVVSANIRESLVNHPVPYFRLKRNTANGYNGKSHVSWFTDSKSCAEALKETTGNIMLTTGSKELGAFASEELKERLFARVLPGKESIELCEKQGIHGRQIIAMQGPFSEELNEALIRQFQISVLVTKESGKAGGFEEKAEAALRCGCELFVIGNPEKEEAGLDFAETLQAVTELAGGCCGEAAGGRSIPEESKYTEVPDDAELKISLIGMGMGKEELLSVEAAKALKEADIFFGAGRLLENLPAEKEKYPYYLADDIVPKLEEIAERAESAQNVAILFSGDTGFFSGTQKVYEALQKMKEEQKRPMQLKIMPGVSSVSYLASRVGISWNDAKIVSIHGRKANLMEAVKRNKKTFALVSGVKDMHKIGEQLAAMAPEGKIRLAVGYQLSYPEEEIRWMTPEECENLTKEGLYCCFIVRDGNVSDTMTHGLKDDVFIRGKVPMTKEEVREVSICKLHLSDDAVLYDVGSGTGSVAVECALLSDSISVYAIERKPEAVELIHKNCEKFGLTNVEVIEAEAPEGLEGLPAPTHVFIGGSGGNIKDILKVLYTKNPNVRIVMNAITLETIGSMTEFLKEIPVQEEEFVQVQVSRSKKAGRYHLMQAENPVTVLSFTCAEAEKTAE